MAVYFIKAAESGTMKIGYTSGNPVTRLKQLQTSCADNLIIIGVIPLGGRDLEKQLHRKFKHLHIRREWFKMDSELKILALTHSPWIAETAPAVKQYVQQRAYRKYQSLDWRSHVPEFVLELLDWCKKGWPENYHAEANG